MNGPPVVAVTGATGFLGRHVVAALLAAAEPHGGARVRVLTRGRMPPADVEAVRGDLADRLALRRLVDGAGCVVHVAGLIKARRRADFFAVNRDGTDAVARAARQAGSRLIVVSSLAAREPHLSAYAASKRQGEAAARAAYHDRPEALTILRPPVIYGPPDRETLALFRAARWPIVPVFGESRIALIHVRDAAGAIVRFALEPGRSGVVTLADANPAGYAMRELLAEAALALDETAAGSAHMRNRLNGDGARRPRFVKLPASVLLAAGTLSEWWGRLRRRAPMFTAGKAREMLHPDWSVHVDELPAPDQYQPATGIAAGFRDMAAWYHSTR